MTWNISGSCEECISFLTVLVVWGIAPWNMHTEGNNNYVFKGIMYTYSLHSKKLVTYALSFWDLVNIVSCPSGHVFWNVGRASGLRVMIAGWRLVVTFLKARRLPCCKFPTFQGASNPNWLLLGCCWGIYFVSSFYFKNSILKPILMLAFCSFSWWVITLVTIPHTSWSQPRKFSVNHIWWFCI